MDSSVARARKLELTAYKRIHWFNSDFHSGFLLNDNQKITEISFDVNPFQIDVNNNLKVVTYIRDSTQSKPIQIKLKEPFNQSREVFNDDNEAFPIIYTNHTGTEGMSTYYPYSVARLIPQQIPRFTFRVDDNYGLFLGNNYFTSITNGDTLPVIKGSPNEKFIIFKSSGSFTLTDKMVIDILVVGGGGGGGSGHGGGGGAGAVIYKTNYNLSSGSYTVTIGAGGSGGAAGGGAGDGTNGGDTTITNGAITIFRAKGGGKGVRVGSGGVGGSGGGAGGSGGGVSTISNDNIPQDTDVFGFAGGSSTGSYIDSGGGGGAGGVGANGSGNNAGNGGSGKQISITGTPVFYAGGGGGGGSTPNGIGGTGGVGGGGTGGSAGGNGTSAIANTGSGGGGAGFNDAVPIIGAAGAGGSGVVIIRYTEIRKRIEGITPDETLIQATNANIPVTVNSQYQINYQTPIVLPKGTYESIFNNGSILFRNKKFPRPWGAYFAEDWSGTTLLDSSGNGRHATTAGTIYSSNLNGNGANAPITYLSGTTTSSITWPTGSIPSTFTILTLARWDGTTQANYQRIFDGGSGNWFQGHIDLGGSLKQIGGAYYNNLWVTTDQPTTSLVPSITDWVCMIGKNSGTAPNNILANGIARGINTGGTPGSPLTINNGTSLAQRSNWAFSVAIIWDTALSDEQMHELNRLINDYKNTGRSIKNDLGLNFDYSYPILKDANNTTIEPINWYKFDTGSLLIDSGTSKANLIAINTAPTADTNNFIKGTSSCLSIRNTTTGNYLTSVVNLTTPFTISFWFNINNANNNSPFGLGADDTSPAISCTYNSSTNKIVTYLATPNTWNTILTSTANININTWYHYTLTISNANPVLSTLYINGVLDTSGSGVSTFSTNNKNLRINIRGDLAAVDSFGGYIDDFRIYSQVLTTTQVAELYNGRLAIYNPPGFILGTEIEPEA